MRKTKLAKLIMGVIFILVLSSMTFATSVDVIPPKGEIEITNATLKDGIYYTTTKDLTLKISAEDNKTNPENLKMLISNKPLTGDELAGASWTTYNAEQPLSMGDNVKSTVYVYLKDEAGNISHNLISASKEYTVTYIAEGAVNVPETQTVIWGMPFNTASKEPSKIDKIFLGWSKEEGAQKATWGSNDVVEPKHIDGNTTLYAVWQDDIRSLAETVKIGDFVNYPVSYENVSSSNLSGWRVLDVENGVVKLISAGTPLTYIKNENSNEELTENFLNGTSSNYVSYGFSNDLKKMFNNLYTVNVESIKESDIKKITGEANILNIDVSNFGGILNNHTSYLIPGETNVYYKDASNGIIEESIESEYGVRLVVTLSKYANTTGKNLKGEWELKIPIHKITYNANGGNITLTNAVTYELTVVSGGKYYGKEEGLPLAYKEYANFIGWFTAKEGGQQITEDTIVDVDSDQTLFARWKENEGVAVYTAGNTTLTFLKPYEEIKVGDTYSGEKVTAVYTGIEKDTYVLNTDVPWYEYATKITKAIVVDPISPVSTSRWFDRVSNLTSVDLAKLDTSNVTTMCGMFQACSKLKKLDVSGFKTSKVTDMSRMFFGATGLTALDVSEFKTENVTTMWGMFYQCTAITALDVSGFDTSNVTDMTGVFCQCKNLLSLDLSNWNTEKVTIMTQMFASCNKITSLDLTSFNTKNVTAAGSMFFEMNTLQEITIGKDFEFLGTAVSTATGSLPTPNKNYIPEADGNWYDVETYEGFTAVEVAKRESGKIRTYSAIPPVAQAIYTEGNTTLTFVKKAPIKVGDTYSGEKVTAVYTGIEEDTYELNTDVPWYEYANEIKTAVVANKISPVSTRRWFDRVTNLESVELTNLDTSNVGTMRAMFQLCSKIDTIDVSNWNTEKVTDMNSIFNQCTNIVSLDVSNWETGNVTDMTGMFNQCYNLTNLDVSNFNTEKVTDMKAMFQQCNNLSTLDVSNWDTGNVKDMRNVFYDCYSLTALDVSNWDTKNVTNMRAMFGAFGADMSIKELNVSKWNTEKVTDMNDMFRKCSNITKLDLSNWNTQNVIDAGNMFNEMNNLQEITIGKDFKFKGTTVATGSLPTPSNTYIPGADRYWYNSINGYRYSAEDIANGVKLSGDTTTGAITYLAVDPRIEVTFNANGGQISGDNAETKIIKAMVGRTYGEAGSGLGLPEAIREGYEFLGWFTKAEDGTEITADMTLVQNANHIVYAHWEEVSTNLITFTIEGDTYYAEEGMTWAKWLDSSYNNGMFVENSYGYISKATDTNENDWLSDAEGGAYSSVDKEIVSGAAYTIMGRPIV